MFMYGLCVVNLCMLCINVIVRLRERYVSISVCFVMSECVVCMYVDVMYVCTFYVLFYVIRLCARVVYVCM